MRQFDSPVASAPLAAVRRSHAPVVTPDLQSWATGRRLITARWQIALAIGVLAVLGVAFLSRTAVLHDGKLYFSLADDAMISMTYARNLAHGAGLVWTPGEAPVEGFTNPLWTMWMALVHVVAPVDRWAPLLTALSGLACLMAGLAAASRIGARLGLTLAGRAFALLSAATLYAPIFWTLRGFEVGLLIAIQSWMLAFALDEQTQGMRKGVILGLLAAAAFLTRMDSLVMTAAILALQLIGWNRPASAGFAASIAILGLAAAGLFVARWVYYGDLLPNTAYLKLESISLAGRLRQGMAADWHALVRWAPLIAFALLPLVLPGGARGAKRFALVAVLFVIAIQFAYTAYIGGDAWEWSGFPDRFVSLTAFPLCLAAGCGFGEMLQRLNLAPRSMVVATAAVTVLAFGWTSFADWRAALAGRGFQFEEEKYLVEAGLDLKAATPPGFRYGLTWAGTIPYYAEGRRPVDLLGKMDRTIARSQPEPGRFKPGHNKYDLAYSLGELRPDAMLQPPSDISGDRDMSEKLRQWGYVTTAGGWWIQPDAARRLSNRRILHARFWWRDAPPISGERPDDIQSADLDPASEAAVAQAASHAAGQSKTSPPRTIGNAPTRAGQMR